MRGFKIIAVSPLLLLPTPDTQFSSGCCCKQTSNFSPKTTTHARMIIHSSQHSKKRDIRKDEDNLNISLGAKLKMRGNRPSPARDIILPVKQPKKHTQIINAGIS